MNEIRYKLLSPQKHGRQEKRTKTPTSQASAKASHLPSPLPATKIDPRGLTTYAFPPSPSPLPLPFPVPPEDDAALALLATLFFTNTGLRLPPDPEEPELRPLPKLPLRLRWPGLLAWKTGALWTPARGGSWAAWPALWEEEVEEEVWCLEEGF